MKHDETKTQYANSLLDKIKYIENELMYNKETTIGLFELQEVTNKFLKLTKPIKKPHSFNTNQNLI